MKGGFSFAFAVPLVISSLFLLEGCGLKYTPLSTEEGLEEARREAIETEYSQTFKTRNKIYKPLTYGELLVVKPDSYKKLDSLFTRKYALQSIGSSDKALDQAIEAQRAVVYNDTIPVLYVETHWYELSADSLHEFIVDQISLNKKNKVTAVKQLDYFECPKELLAFARKYMLEDYFVEYTYEPTQNEIDFYTTYKEHAGTLTGREKQAFVVHTLKIMQLANKYSTLSTEMLLNKLTATRISQADSNANPKNMHYSFERIMEDREGIADAFLYYQVTANVPGSSAPPFVFRYDYYLQPVE